MPTRDYEPRPFQEPPDEFWRFVKIGAAVTIGVLAVLSIGWMAQLAYANYQLEQARKSLESSMQNLQRQSAGLTNANLGLPRFSPAQPYQPPFPAHNEIVRITPKDRAYCMKQFAGSFNEGYLRCIRGYTYTVWVASADELSNLRRRQATEQAAGH